MLTKGNKKKGLTINVTLEQTITVLILVCIAFAGGLFTEYSVHQANKTIEQNQCDSYTGFTKKDLNILGQLTYNGGYCERQGLISSVIVQQTDKNEIYGIPICVEGGEK